ncbi:MAG: ATP-binding cassette domain-containing protein [Leptolyngbyaceae cyanobacterium]
MSSRGERLLAAVSCQFYAGEFVALLGPSGAGKSTLFKIMNRLKSATDGALYFIGRPLAAMPVRELRQRVMLVGQNSQLLNMTVKQALHYPLAIQQCSLKEQEVRVDEWLDRLQIPLEWLDQTELQLSGGQKQQVAIARALIARPQLLLLDEPTSALDLGAATRILTVIREEIEKRDLAVVMSNHQLELAQDHCDRILYLENGQLQLDQPADKVDWAELRQKFLTADASSQEEWGDSDEAF